MIGALSSGMGLGSIIFPPIAQRLISIYQWRFSFIIFAIIIIAVILIATQFLKWDPRRIGLKPYGESETDNKHSDLAEFSLTQSIRTRQFWLIGGLYFIYVFCQTVVLVHIYVHALGMNVSPASAAGIVSIYGVFQIAGMNVSGYMADRFGNKAVFFVSFILMTISFIWLLMVSRDALTFYVFAATMGLAAGSIQIIFAPIIAEIFGLKSQGVILGSVSFMASFGGASGSVIAGLIFDVNHSYTLAFIICAILAASGVVFTSLIRPVAPSKVEIKSSEIELG